MASEIKCCPTWQSVLAPWAGQYRGTLPVALTMSAPWNVIQEVLHQLKIPRPITQGPFPTGSREKQSQRTGKTCYKTLGETKIFWLDCVVHIYKLKSTESKQQNQIILEINLYSLQMKKQPNLFSMKNSSSIPSKGMGKFDRFIHFPWIILKSAVKPSPSQCRWLTMSLQTLGDKMISTSISFSTFLLQNTAINCRQFTARLRCNAVKPSIKLQHQI